MVWIGGIVNFYEADKHQGHLVCPDCEQAEMVYVAPYAQNGGNKKLEGISTLLHGEKYSGGVSVTCGWMRRDPSG